MGYLVAILLSYMPEQEAFWVFVRMLNGPKYKFFLYFVIRKFKFGIPYSFLQLTRDVYGWNGSGPMVFFNACKLPGWTIIMILSHLLPFLPLPASLSVPFLLLIFFLRREFMLFFGCLRLTSPV